VDYLARVEGETSLTIRFRKNQPANVELRIFEPPRFFEGFLRGRSCVEAPDITSRICGICPVAYQMSACAAVEDALGVEVGPEIDALRRLMYAGEWIESHALHVFLLHAPDFLGYPSGLAMAKDHPDPVRAGLRIKKAGNSIVRALGGREIHPINVKVGGFHRAPSRRELGELLPELEWSREHARKSLEWMAGFSFPVLDRDYELVALTGDDYYPLMGGRIASNKGLDLAVSEYDSFFVEEQVERSTALHSTIRGRGAYLCGALARINLGIDRLSPAAAEAARAIGFSVPCKNPFKSLLARMLEIIHSLDTALSIISAYVPPRAASVPVTMRAGTGYGATEAPRGLLYHRYQVSDDGTIEHSKIVPPTSQNQKSIEDDLLELAPRLARMPHSEATALAEHTVRNHDPCISCSTHFLKLDVLHE